MASLCYMTCEITWKLHIVNLILIKEAQLCIHFLYNETFSIAVSSHRPLTLEKNTVGSLTRQTALTDNASMYGSVAAYVIADSRQQCLGHSWDVANEPSSHRNDIFWLEETIMLLLLNSAVWTRERAQRTGSDLLMCKTGCHCRAAWC